MATIDFMSVGLFIVVLVVILKLRNSFNNPLPPGPKGWPILGNVLAISRDPRHMHEVLFDWAKRYGSIMTINTFMETRVVLSDFSAVKEALIKQPDAFQDKIVFPIRAKTMRVTGSFLFDSGDTAKLHRRFGINALRNLGVGKRNMEEKINEELRYLIECLESKENRPFDPSIVVYNAASNIICALIFGSRFDYDDERFHTMLNTMNSIISSTGPNAVGNLIPALAGTRLYFHVRKLVKKVEDFIGGIVKEHHDSYDPNDLRDFIDMYIAEVKKKEGATGTAAFQEENIYIGAMDLFAAGTDTTSNTVLWLILYAITHSEIQDKIQQEISKVVGNDRQPSLEDRLKMPFTNAAIMEMQRWRPVVTQVLPYKTSRETRLLGYSIPQGTGILVNLWGVLQDPKVWKRPEEFDPSRFLTEDGTKVLTPEAFIPFSIGRRSCLGEGLAKKELFLFVTNLFQRFTFKLPTGKPRPGFNGTLGITYTPPPFEVCAFKR